MIRITKGTEAKGRPKPSLKNQVALVGGQAVDVEEGPTYSDEECSKQAVSNLRDGCYFCKEYQNEDLGRFGGLHDELVVPIIVEPVASDGQPSAVF